MRRKVEIEVKAEGNSSPITPRARAWKYLTAQGRGAARTRVQCARAGMFRPSGHPSSVDSPPSAISARLESPLEAQDDQ